MALFFSVMISLGEWSELQSKSNSPSSSTSHNPDTYFISIFEYANNKAITNTQPNTFIEAKVKEQASAEITDTNSQANTNENMISKTYRNELQVPHKLSMLDISRQLLLINETEQLFQDIHTEISTSKNSEVTTGSIHDQYKEGTEQDSFPSNTAYDLSDSDSEEQLDWLNNEKLDITRKLHFLILEKRKRNHKRQQQPDEEYEEILFNQFKKLFEEAMENELKRTDKPMKIDVSKKFLDSNHKYCTLLHTAASSEALLIMNYLVEVCLMNVDVLDNMHSTPLFYACASNCPNACLFLLSKGAKPNIRDHFENFPLLVAIRNGNFNCADHLLLYGADINFTGRKGTCLHAMCQCGSLEKVNYLTSAGKEGNSTNLVSKNRHGQTPLFLALPYPEIVDLLLRKMRINAEKSPNSTELFFKWLKLQDENHRSVFHLCCELGYMKSLLLIVSYCSSDMLREVFAERDDIKKSTPLHLAITAKHYDLAKILVLSNEVDVNIRDQNGNTPLHLALDIEDLDHCKKFVDLLINMGNPNLQIKNNMKLTPIKLAKEKNIELTKNDDTNELKIDLKYLTETPFLKQNLNDATLNFTMDLNNYFSKIQASEMRRKQHSATNKNVEKLSKTYDLLDAYKIDEHLFPELLEFKEFVSFGIKFLDDQNQKLFDMTNSLYIICTKRYSDLDRKSTEYVISNLIEYAYTQFNNEIRLINYHFSNSNDTVRKELEQHENEHEEFKKSLEKYHERLKKSEDYFELQLLHMLTSFIKNHIIKKDKLLYASVIEKMIYNRDFL
jgi:hemerythrin-like metal-binding protein